MTDYVQTKAQLLARLEGNQPTTLLMRDIVETLFTEGVDPVAAIEGVIGEGGNTAQTLPSRTTVQLEDIGDAINITGKFITKVVINATTGLLVKANGPDAADLWLNLDGTTAHTPV
jgi:hypothetical protein